MEYPADLLYTKDHEWIRYEDGTATIGITAFAQDELGEIVYVELPDPGTEFTQGESVCVVESTKAASDVYAPVGGKISEINSLLDEQPDLVNTNSYGDGWLVKLVDINEDELEGLMDSDEYQSLVEK